MITFPPTKFKNTSPSPPSATSSPSKTSLSDAGRLLTGLTQEQHEKVSKSRAKKGKGDDGAGSGGRKMRRRAGGRWARR